MVEDLDRIKLGEEGRELRKAKGLKMEDIVTDGLSQSTISNIEKGHPQVSIQKIKLYCDFIGYDLEQAPTWTGEKFRTKAEKEKRLHQIKLMMVENLIRSNDHRTALKELSMIKLLNNDPLQAKFYFMKGSIFNLKNKHEEAEKFFHKAIRTVDLDPDRNNQGNIKAYSFLSLCRIAYYHNNFKQALKNAKKAYKAFDPEQGNIDLKYMILSNQVIYLELLGYREKAFTLLKELREDEKNINNLDVKLVMYQMHAKILSKSEMFQEAIENAEKGLEIAISNSSIGRAGELWVILGSIYKKMGEKNVSIECLKTARMMLTKANKDQQTLRVDVLLGEIYNQKKLWRQTQRMLEEVISTIDEESPYLIRYIEALIILGDSYFHLGKQNSCEEIFVKALELARKYELHNLERRVLLKLVSFFNQTNPNHANPYLNDYIEKSRELEKGGVIDD